jgi:tRNA (Thr-GGU) A37 N-methylase
MTQPTTQVEVRLTPIGVIRSPHQAPAGTPLLDIKPYVPEFDAHPSSKAGWLDECREDRREADHRFHGGDPENA